jgi:hypothetical protein
MAQWLVAHLPLAPLSHLAGQTALVAMSGYPPHTPYPDLPVVFPQNSDRSSLRLLHETTVIT